MKASPIRAGLLASSLLILLSAGCGQRVKLDEEFIMRPGDKVFVTGAGLSMRLESVGHQWYTDQRADSAYVDLTVRAGGDLPRSMTISWW